MKAHVEIRIHLSLDEIKTLHDVLRRFASKTKGWKFPTKQSKDYQNLHQHPAGFALCDSVEGLESAAVAVANLNPKQPNSFRVTNIIIIPQNCSSLTMDQYNAIGKAFVDSFRRFLRLSKLRGRVNVQGPEIGLAQIIRGAECRRYFDAWLHTPTPTGHPSDVDALDGFTCAIFRYGSKVDLDKLERYLVEDRKWDSKSVVWAIRRILTGLDILEVDRRF